jgi:hypothetical protein
VVSNDTNVMTVEGAVSTAMLGGFIWAISALLPNAVKGDDPLALTCAVLTAILTLLGWLFIGVTAFSASS